MGIKFAMTIAFGAQMGNRLESVLSNETVYKYLRDALPGEYDKWAPTIVKYFCKFMGVTLAWMVQRMVFAFHTSISGGTMLASGVIHYLVKTGKVNSSMVEKHSATSKYLGGALACLGFYAQFVRGFSNTGWIGLLLFPVFVPLHLFEFLLEMFIG